MENMTKIISMADVHHSIHERAGVPLTQSQNNANMSALFLLIGISLLAASACLAAFLRSVQNGQFNDIQTPSVRMLFDRAEFQSKSKSNGNKEVLEKG